MGDRLWFVAVARALLADLPYLTVSVSPGDATVEEHGDLSVSVLAEGRLPERVVLQSREVDAPDAPWEVWDLPLENPEDAAANEARFLATFTSVGKPVDYQVVAGKHESPIYRISVRYPIAMTKLEADLAPPEYTGVAASTVTEPDFEVIEGTQVRFRAAFDRPCAEASLVLAPRGKESGDPSGAGMQRLAMRLERDHWVAELPIGEERRYRIEARGEDGTALPVCQHRLRVRKDRPPRVTFLEPDEALEVHPIAEIYSRVRVEDEFGLTRAGIVFRVNSGEERTLLLENFAKPGTDGKPVRRTRESVEATLLLEEFALHETDGVTYYAFAEDNRPGKPNRTETDLRFIDIRPFRRVYKIGGT
jgi:hypothetical protein